MFWRLGDKRVETEGDDYYVAPGAQLIGWVRLGRGASVWFNSVLRGDSDWIIVGEGTNVQDGTVIHTDPGVPVRIGRNVTIGHRVFLHGCTVDDDTLIANGALVLDGVRIGRNCVIAAGALIPPGKEIPDGSVVMGVPGQIVRRVTERDLAMIAHAGEHYRQRAVEYRKLLQPDDRGG
ncbi:MAG: gamma carbonic anhydrase family protein [Pseudomonadota bacterium]|jgi:Carbonic anhydrases/acetyltransferases, isoleucine patch superfamily|nr:MAG: gamma carbonic anhydrase family protein [Pseudomonadota bacterium]